MTRNQGPDVLRAAAIYGVVFIHLSASDPAAHVFRYCVPVFVALWAVYFEQGLARRPPAERPAYVRSRLGRLLVAYLFWSALYLLRYAPAGWPAGAIARDWLRGEGWPGQYFLVVMLQLTVVWPLVRERLGRRTLFVGWAAGVVVVPLAGRWLMRTPDVARLGDQPFVYWLPYVAVGAAWARAQLPRLPALALVVAGVAALALAPAEYTRTQSPSAYLLVSVAVGSVALLLATAREGGAPGEPGVFGRAVGYVGRNTFAVFVTNPLVIGVLLRTPVREWLDGPGALAARAVVAVGVVAAGLGIGWAFRRARLGVLVGG